MPLAANNRRRLGFYGGQTPEEYPKGDTLQDATVLSWLKLFQEKARTIMR